MLEVILVGMLATALHATHAVELGKDVLQQTRVTHQGKTNRWHRRCHYLTELHRDTLLSNYVYSLRLTTYAVVGLVVDIEAELRGKSHSTHHAQRVVGEGCVGLARGADNAILEVVDATKRIDQLAKCSLVERPGEGIYREVAAALIVLQRAWLNMRVARLRSIALAACANKLNLGIAPTKHCRAIGLEYRYLGAQPPA